jgi:hypothetical protein
MSRKALIDASGTLRHIVIRGIVRSRAENDVRMGVREIEFIIRRD